MGGGGGRGLLQLDVHSLDGLKNGKTELVRVHGWQGTRVTLVTTKGTWDLKLNIMTSSVWILVVEFAFRIVETLLTCDEGINA